MSIYKISFLKNEVLSIREADPNTQFDGTIYLEHDKGQLIFAIVRAQNEAEARNLSQSIIASTRQNQAAL